MSDRTWLKLNYAAEVGLCFLGEVACAMVAWGTGPVWLRIGSAVGVVICAACAAFWTIKLGEV